MSSPFSRLLLRWIGGSSIQSECLVDSKTDPNLAKCSCLNGSVLMIGDPLARSFRFVDHRNARHLGTFLKVPGDSISTGMDCDMSLKQPWKLSSPSSSTSFSSSSSTTTSSSSGLMKSTSHLPDRWELALEAPPEQNERFDRFKHGSSGDAHKRLRTATPYIKPPRDTTTSSLSRPQTTTQHHPPSTTNDSTNLTITTPTNTPTTTKIPKQEPTPPSPPLHAVDASPDPTSQPPTIRPRNAFSTTMVPELMLAASLVAQMMVDRIGPGIDGFGVPDGLDSVVGRDGIQTEMGRSIGKKVKKNKKKTSTTTATVTATTRKDGRGYHHVSSLGELGRAKLRGRLELKLAEQFAGKIY